jgi:hypothetical protein
MASTSYEKDGAGRLWQLATNLGNKIVICYQLPNILHVNACESLREADQSQAVPLMLLLKYP